MLTMSKFCVSILLQAVKFEGITIRINSPNLLTNSSIFLYLYYRHFFLKINSEVVLKCVMGTNEPPSIQTSSSKNRVYIRFSTLFHLIVSIFSVCVRLIE